MTQEEKDLFVETGDELEVYSAAEWLLATTLIYNTLLEIEAIHPHGTPEHALMFRQKAEELGLA